MFPYPIKTRLQKILIYFNYHKPVLPAPINARMVNASNLYQELKLNNSYRCALEVSKL